MPPKTSKKIADPAPATADSPAAEREQILALDIQAPPMPDTAGTTRYKRGWNDAIAAYRRAIADRT